MSTSWSCSIYTSDNDESNEDSCIPSHDNSKIDVPSASRPLIYTITMSSGSSGANTFSSMSDSEGLSSSEPSTRAGTPPETRAAELRGNRGLLSPTAIFPQNISNELLRINPALFISPNSLRQEQGYEAETESSFSRLVLDSGVLSPLEESEGNEEQSSVARSSIWERRTGAARGRAVSTSDSSRSSRSRKVSPNRDDQILSSSEDIGVVEVPLISRPLLQRSRRPPPLNLSAISCTQPRAQEKSVFDFEEDPSPNTPKRPFTAPFARQTNSDMKPEPPHPPATAPFLTMPKAPLIRPSVLTFERSPSPLTLSSPCLSWSFDSASQPTTASTSSTLWSPTCPPSTSFPRSGKNFMESRRRTLGRQIATLRAASASGPIPPSLRNSPILSHITSPRPATGSPLDFPVADFSFGTDPISPPTHFIGTPFRRHMNPYFSDALTTNGKGVSRCIGEASPPISPCNPYFAAAERPEVGCRK